MADPDFIIRGAGGGGGKGGSGGDFTQTPDNLRSEDKFEGLLALGHGKWKGPVHGLKSISINGTPLEDASGSINFPGWQALFANGDPTMWPSQLTTLVLGAASAPVLINVGLANTTGTGTPVVRTVPNTGADFIDLRFIVNQLYHQTDKGIFEQTMHIKIRMKPSGSTNWIEVLADVSASEPAFNEGGNSFLGGTQIYNSRSFYDVGGARVTE